MSNYQADSAYTKTLLNLFILNPFLEDSELLHKQSHSIKDCIISEIYVLFRHTCDIIQFGYYKQSDLIRWTRKYLHCKSLHTAYCYTLLIINAVFTGIYSQPSVSKGSLFGYLEAVN